MVAITALGAAEGLSEGGGAGLSMKPSFTSTNGVHVSLRTAERREAIVVLVRMLSKMTVWFGLLRLGVNCNTHPENSVYML